MPRQLLFLLSAQARVGYQMVIVNEYLQTLLWVGERVCREGWDVEGGFFRSPSLDVVPEVSLTTHSRPRVFHMHAARHSGAAAP